MQSMATRHPHTGAPKRLYSLLEWRALLEMALLPTSWPLLMQAPRGDGHPVLLLPGFMGDEGSLIGAELVPALPRLRRADLGLGRNVGFQRRHAQALEQKIRHLHHVQRPQGQPGGLEPGRRVRALRRAPGAECVRQVITLGSPVSVDAHGSQSPPLVKALYRLIAHPMGPGRTHAAAREEAARTLLRRCR
jgi:hypothetical protein